MTYLGSERRQSERLPVELYVEFRHLGKGASYRELSRDLSEGGFFLSTSVVLPPGTEVELRLATGQGARPIRLRAEVVRVEDEPAQKGSKKTAPVRGMGLRFVDSDEGEVARLMMLARQVIGEGKSRDAGRGKSNER